MLLKVISSMACYYSSTVTTSYLEM